GFGIGIDVCPAEGIVLFFQKLFYQGLRADVSACGGLLAGNMNYGEEKWEGLWNPVWQMHPCNKRCVFI
ncbi:MAG: hypothetical protein LBH58_12425, partial [Tannerellaceae bacterium]|nr:hypothetical protein [Tannerellaceae bacterium]